MDAGVGHISRELAVAQPYVSVLLARLVERGLLLRSGQDDGRLHRYRLGSQFALVPTA